MLSPRLFLLLLATALHHQHNILVDAAPENDRVLNFPGWDGQLPSKIYSGFVDSDEQGWMHTHYVFVESENDPKHDPVVLWFNGGPGASSLFGFFIELGPFILSGASLQTAEYNSTGVPSVFYNPNTWSKVSNILIVNSPPPVGFSYCDTFGPSGNGTSCGDWNDTRTAQSNHVFLINWMKAFPEFQSNPVFVTGESYAGVYVPTLVREIINDPNNTINIQGFAVGDACMGTDVLCGDHDGPFWDIIFMYGHGQFSTKLYNQIMTVCNLNELKTGNGVTDECSMLLAQAENEIGPFYEYNLYDECWYQNGLGLKQFSSWSHPIQKLPRRTFWGPRLHTGNGGDERGNENDIEEKEGLTAALNDYPCGGSGAMVVYLNSSIVRQLLNVPLNDYFFTGDDGVGFNYTLTEKDLRPFYVQVARNTNIRALVYNGDTDPGINSFIAQNWTSNLGLEETEEWRPWTLDGKQRMGGYVTEYEGDFNFLTIRGSGHMVPEFKPAAALEFLTRWLRNEDWKPYVQPASRNRKLDKISTTATNQASKHTSVSDALIPN
eukprot:c12769_g1_i1.p1 GENE.c12769_g1_i1~~c12769_g1_i1.p1  ORF type:complete len:549 (+),score=114.78 c12769_g1_i1:1347-2993(+)